MSAATVAHTPGPWRVIDETDILALEATPSSIVIAATKFFEGPATEQQKADARLIAAAPELLAALKGAYEFTPAHGADCGGTLVVEEDAIFEEIIGCTCFLSEWKAAIFKAEGRSEP